MYDIRRFWLDSHIWPIDTPEWIFLGNAVHRIGTGLFNENWTGYEPSAWASSGTEREAQRDGIQRFGEVAHTIRSEAVAGRLVTGMRSRDGGNVTPMPAEWWNTEKLRPRFKMCQIAPSYPFGDGSGFARSGYRNRNDYGAPEYCWIFVDQDTLDRLVAEIKPDKVATTADRRKAVQYLTPLLTEQKPAGVTKASVRQQCMDELGISDRTFRAAWDSIEKHPSWPKAGRPKSSQ